MEGSGSGDYTTTRPKREMTYGPMLFAEIETTISGFCFEHKFESTKI